MDDRQKKLVESNIGLVYHIVNKKFNYKSSHYDFEDLVSIGTIGLIKAALTFVEDKGSKFATYSGRCIENEIRMFIRKNARDSLSVSLDIPIPGLKDDSIEYAIIEVVSDKNVNIEEAYENAMYLNFVIDIILNCFSRRDRNIMLYNIAGCSQLKISQFLNISQSYVSRLIKNISNKLLDQVSKDTPFKKRYLFETTGTTFKVFYSLCGEKRLIFQGLKCRETFVLLVDALNKFEDQFIDCN